MADIGITPNKDGTVSIVLDDDRTVTIRRATLGEYADFIDYARTADDKANALRKELLESINSDNPDPNEQRALTDQIAEARWPVVARLFADFGNTPEFDFSTAPVWLAKRPVDVIQRVLETWETVPFHGSGRNGS